MAEQSRRFVSPDKPIDKFIEDQKNKNTLSKTRRDVSLLTEFLNQTLLAYQFWLCFFRYFQTSSSIFN